MLEEVRIEKLIHGGQGIGTLSDGKKIFVWNALPGELVRVRKLKSKRSYVQGIAEEVVEASPARLEPREDNFLATSPWQILDIESENKSKGEITQELFTQAHVDIPAFQVVTAGSEWNYRNKMEYSFWGDDEGIHLALHKRGSHGKEIVDGSMLALPAIDSAANIVLEELKKLPLRAGDLKTLVVRCNQAGDSVAALFIKPTNFPNIALPVGLKGLRVYHSNPRSPASVATKLIQEIGDCTLTDELLGNAFVYDVDSFFQVNVPVFENALKSILQHNQQTETVDMYAGVGTIGLSLVSHSVTLVELDFATAKMATLNAQNSSTNAIVVEVSTEKALEYITPEIPVIFDPPRAGLHEKVIDKVLLDLPPQVTYLSCNPVTQARDIARLQKAYEIEHFEVFNFFPKTPHIESLAVLRPRASS